MTIKNIRQFLILFLFLFCESCNPLSRESKSILSSELLNKSFPAHYPENTIDAIILRTIITSHVLHNDTTKLIMYIKNVLATELAETDSTIYNRIYKRLTSDKKTIEDCEYLHKTLSYADKIESKHFVVYNLNSKVDTSQINLYDKQFNELSKLFKSKDSSKLTLVLDTNLNYWRAFPLWDIKYGLLQRYINGNPHELVHHFFTKYSDVPFFHEPIAFLYGDYKNDTNKFYKKFTSLNSQVSNKTYRNAKEIWHFPAIVILEKYDKLSFWLFTSTLMQKFGIEKFIEFASLTTWDKSNHDFENNFKIVYNQSLNDFEQKYIIHKLPKH